MKHKYINNGRFSLAIALGLLGTLNLARADSVGHYVPAFFNIRDYFVPAPGLYGAIYSYYYTTDRLNDQNGHQVNSVTISPGPGPGVTLGVSRRSASAWPSSFELL
jgi:hypothetical protein